MPDPGLKQRVQTQMMAAMKAGDKPRTQVLRMVLSEIKAQEADHPEADPQLAVTAYAKKLRKTMAEMERLNQPAQVQQLQSELAIVEEYLPKPMEDTALERLVEQTLAGLGPLTAKDTGRAIGAVMKALAATGASADAGKVRAMIGQRLA